MKTKGRFFQLKQRGCRIPFHVYLLYLLIASFLMTGVSFCSYVSSASGGDTARVAGAVISTQVTGEGDSISLNQPNTSANYSFTVSNGAGAAVSQVTLQYDVIVELAEALPAGVTILLDGRTGGADMDRRTYTFSGAGTLAAGAQVSNNHTLTFTAGDGIYTASSVQVSVSVRVEQID